MRAARAASSSSSSVASGRAKRRFSRTVRVEQVGLLRDDADVAAARSASVRSRTSTPSIVTLPRRRRRRAARPGSRAWSCRGRSRRPAPRVVPGSDDEVDVAQRRAAVVARRRSRHASKRDLAAQLAGSGTRVAPARRSRRAGRGTRRSARTARATSARRPARRAGCDREEQPGLQRGERDHGADRDRAPPDAIAWPGEQVDERRHHGEGDLHRRHHPAARHPRAHLEVGAAGDSSLEPLGQLAAAAHRLRRAGRPTPTATPRPGSTCRPASPAGPS